MIPIAAAPCNNGQSNNNHVLAETTTFACLNPTGFLIEPETAPLESAITVYNLALSHQVQDRCAWKARVFYELAYVIMALQGVTSPALNHAINNNLQVWSNDNRDNPYIIRPNGGTLNGGIGGGAAIVAGAVARVQSSTTDSDDRLLQSLLSLGGS